MTDRNDARRKRFRATIARTKPACHICGNPIDYTLTWPHPMSFVIDHKKALKLGGTDTLDNVAAAHAECNSKKRARTHAPIVRRSGSLD